MTRYEFYEIIFLAAAALCIISLIVTIIAFFKLNIIKAVGDLTGRNAKKGIEGINAHNINSKNADSEKFRAMQARQITDRISPSGKVVRVENLSPISTTEKIHTDKMNQTTVFCAEETTVLSSNETTVLSSNETTVLSAGETTVLSGDETTVLGNFFIIEEDITYTYSQEII